ncbi:iron-sulfur cluster assembly scaffold protein [Yoonia sp. R2331]|uniref:iron-sulfur cluster assembly scaffold protein n=1 Tax=Yoonia sp. R2331 TaxID=3237238 RepID=UPI0034E52471
MSNDADLMKLYSQRILALAADLSHTDRLTDPDASCKKRSPLCGSTVTVDLLLDGDQVTGYAQDVKACALGQAAASVVGREVVGLDRATITKGRDQLLAMLKAGGPVPDAPFAGLEVLEPARDYKNRHASIMLAFEATLGAFDDVKISS